MKLVDKLREIADTVQPQFGAIIADTIRQGATRIEAGDKALAPCEWTDSYGVESEVACCPCCGGAEASPDNAKNAEFYEKRSGLPKGSDLGHADDCPMAAYLSLVREQDAE